MDTVAAHPVQERLHRLARENLGLQEAAQFYERLIPVMKEAEDSIPAIALEGPGLERKLQAGIPLLVDEPLPFDAQQAHRIFQSVCIVMRETGATGRPMEQGAREILGAISRQELDLPSMLAVAAQDQAGPFEEIASRLGLDARLLELAAQTTLKVFLRVWCKTVAGQVDLNTWQRALCPICGAAAALAEDREVAEDRSSRQQRYLRCLRCGAAWMYPNLRCAFCGNEDYQSLGVLLLEEQIRTQYIHTCDRCKRYIKTTVTFDAIPTDLLMVADLATLPLDLLAAERGYAK